MTAPIRQAAIEPLSLREVAFEHFEEFFNSISEQAQFTPAQQLALGEQLMSSVGNLRDEIWPRGAHTADARKFLSLIEWILGEALGDPDVNTKGLVTVIRNAGPR
jgi:hypothetical protein